MSDENLENYFSKIYALLGFEIFLDYFLLQLKTWRLLLPNTIRGLVRKKLKRYKI